MLSARRGAIKPIASAPTWSRETDVLEEVLQRWDIGDRAELCVRALWRMRCEDGERLTFDIDPSVEGLRSCVVGAA